MCHDLELEPNAINEPQNVFTTSEGCRAKGASQMEKIDVFGTSVVFNANRVVVVGMRQFERADYGL